MTVSGPDSFKAAFRNWLESKDIRSIIEVNCGAFGWLDEIIERRRYMGFDPCLTVVRANVSDYPHRYFTMADPLNAIRNNRHRDAQAVLIQGLLHHVGSDTAATIVKQTAAFRNACLVVEMDESGVPCNVHDKEALQEFERFPDKWEFPVMPGRPRTAFFR